MRRELLEVASRVGAMTDSDRLMLERLVKRAEADAGLFSSWELDRLEEWRGRTDLSRRQIEVLTRVDLNTA